MKQYDITCPICGTVNKGLYLDETDGWMVCEKCGNETQDMNYVRQHTVKVPVFVMRDEGTRVPAKCAV